MNYVNRITLFHFHSLFKSQTLFLTVVLVFNLIISLVVTISVNDNANAGATDFVALIWVLVIGLTFFSTAFRFLLSLGVSRRSFFFASLLSLVGLAAAWGILVTVVAVASREFTSTSILFEFMYADSGVGSEVVWEFAALLFLALLGWFIQMVYYVAGKKTKIAVSLAPFGLAPLLVLFNSITGGAVFRGMGKFFTTVLGFGGAEPDPLIAAGSFVLASVVLAGFTYLLVRRAQVKFS